MPVRNQALTAANIRYLLVLRQLCPDDGVTRCVHVAEMLGISKSSVHTMMNSLKDMELIEKDRYGTVRFTEKGSRLSTLYTDYFEFMSRELYGVIPQSASRDIAVCAFLAEVPEKDLELAKQRREEEEERNVS